VQKGDYSIFVQIVIGDPPHSISSSKSFSIQIILGSYGLYNVKGYILKLLLVKVHIKPVRDIVDDVKFISTR
jgi:hypothetical protein